MPPLRDGLRKSIGYDAFEDINIDKEKYMSDVSPIVRTAVFVTDLEKSIEFYTDILGYEEVFFRGDLGEPFINKLLGMPSTSFTRAIIIKQAGPGFGMIGLFEVTKPAPPKITKSHDGCHIGEICMTFYCSDIQEIYEKLARHGSTIIAKPEMLDIADAPGAGVKEMTFLGPDGEMFSMIEMDPKVAFLES
jgi:catechol 2,3-dioxygenase-like lactoylglutathione lyase family enzyme